MVRIVERFDCVGRFRARVRYVVHFSLPESGLGLAEPRVEAFWPRNCPALALRTRIASISAGNCRYKLPIEPASRADGVGGSVKRGRAHLEAHRAGGLKSGAESRSEYLCG